MIRSVEMATSSIGDAEMGGAYEAWSNSTAAQQQGAGKVDTVQWEIALNRHNFSVSITALYLRTRCWLKQKRA